MRIGVMLRAIEERQGIGIYSRNLLKEMIALDDENEYVLFYRQPSLLGTFAGHSRVSERHVRAPGKAAWDQVAMPLAARREKIDLIFHTKFTVPFLTGRPTVMTIHGASWFVHPELYTPLDVAYIRAVMPLYCRKAKFIISNSDLTTNDFIRIVGVPPRKIRTVRLGRNPDFRPMHDRDLLADARRRYALPEKFILSVIKYDPRKNFTNLIAAFRRLRQRTDCKLVVAGIGCEKYRDEYRLEEDGTADDVQFLGWVEQDDLPCLYNLARCLFFPSVYEEFGIPTCEAMGCGCPPVVSKTGAPPEIAGDAGLLVDQFNPQEMADALERIWTDDELHRRLSRASIERAADFTWRRCAEETLAILNDVGRSET